MKKTLVLSTLLAAWSFASAQQTLKPTQVNIFKNGTYFIVKEGAVTPKNSIVSIAVPSQPLLGTYWINTAKDVKVEKIIYETDTLKKMMTAQSIPEVIFANKGKKVKVDYKTDDKSYREVSGTLQDYFKSSGMLKIKTLENKTLYILVNTVSDFTLEETPADKMLADSLSRIA